MTRTRLKDGVEEDNRSNWQRRFDCSASPPLMLPLLLAARCCSGCSATARPLRACGGPLEGVARASERERDCALSLSRKRERESDRTWPNEERKKKRNAFCFLSLRFSCRSPETKRKFTSRFCVLLSRARGYIISSLAWKDRARQKVGGWCGGAKSKNSKTQKMRKELISSSSFFLSFFLSLAEPAARAGRVVTQQSTGEHRCTFVGLSRYVAVCFAFLFASVVNELSRSFFFFFSPLREPSFAVTFSFPAVFAESFLSRL